MNRSPPHLGEIVLTAAGLDGAEREAYLRQIAATDPDLAAAARRRIAAAESVSDSFLETPAAARLQSAGEAEAGEPPSGEALPASERYELGECLGEGGMGRVVLAFDRQLGRSVALKLLTHEDPAILRLFLREARTQARVRHDHVLDIYDSGILDGQPYIAMRYVAGGTLADLDPTLPLERKLRLLIQAAEGLHAAHSEGLLHRDVKPSNILVEPMPDGDLKALVTDFGLATELGDAESMAADAVAGSPYYIAPERLAGTSAAVDRRSDVYSLGMTLYRLLTGEVPFSGDETVHILRQALEGELPRPRQRLPSLPVELEAIILRSIARDPGERYSSTRAVAEDLRRYLAGEVTEAYTAGLAYRLTRFVLRHKLLTGMTAVAVAALVAASVGITVFALRADAARHRAELRQGQAEELIRFLVVDLDDKLESLGRLDILDEAGEAAREYFAAVPEEELSEEEMLRRSRMLYQIGTVRLRQGDLAGAVTPMEESLALTRRLAELAPDDGERLFELGQSCFWVGNVYWEQGDLAATRGPWEAYLDVSRRLVDKDPANSGWRRELSYAHSNLGSLLEAEGDLEGALAQFLATLAIDEELAAADPANAGARSELAATHNTVGVVLQKLGRLGEAGEHLQADLEIRRELLAVGPAEPRERERLGASLGYLGIHRFIQGELEQARDHFGEAQRVFGELVRHDPANTAWRYQLAWSHLNLGRVSFARGDLATAREAWRIERRLIDELFTLDSTPHKWSRTRATDLYYLALLQRARGEPGARGTVLAATEILEELAAERPADRQILRWLSRSYLLLGALEGSPPAAKEAFARAAEILEPLVRGSRDGRVLAPWAEALFCLGRLDEAREVAETLRLLGYAEPGPGLLCDAETGGPAGKSPVSMSSISSALRRDDRGLTKR